MTEPTTTPETGATPPAGTDPDKPLGEAGQRALAAEREARKALEKQLADQAKQFEALAPLKDLAAAIGVKPEQGKTDTETLTAQIATLQKQQAEAELRALRLEVAAEKGLTPAQAARLQGASRDELTADADALKALFPGGTSATPGIPAPDPSQGARGGSNELEGLLKAAQEKGNTREAIRLKTAIAASKTGK
jgi:hypothetical protein